MISLKNIHSVLENNEIEAWQKLIRVLTHEIMNSLAPIISLSETLTERVARTTTEDATSPVMLQALEAIHRRSKGLLEFVQNYRKLTRIPAPELVPLSLEELFTGLRKLHATSVFPVNLFVTIPVCKSKPTVPRSNRYSSISSEMPKKPVGIYRLP